MDKKIKIRYNIIVILLFIYCLFVTIKCSKEHIEVRDTKEVLDYSLEFSAELDSMIIDEEMRIDSLKNVLSKFQDNKNKIKNLYVKTFDSISSLPADQSVSYFTSRTNGNIAKK